MKSIAKNSFYNVLLTVANFAFPLFTASYVAHILLPDGVGAVSYAQTQVSYFTMTLTGISIFGTREIAKLRDNPQDKNKFYSSIMVLNTILTSGALSFYLILLLCNSPLFLDQKLSAICMLYITINFFNLEWVYTGHEEYGYITLRSILFKALSTICIFVFVKNVGDIYIYALIVVFSSTGNYLINLFGIRKYVSFSFRGVSFNQYLKPIFFLSACSFFSNVYMYIDITMLGKICNAAVTGYYTNAQKIVNIALSVTLAITNVMLPRLSYYYQNDRKKFHELVTKGIDVILLCSIPMFTGILFFAKDIILILFGNAFAAAVPILRLFSAFIIIKTFSNLLCYQISICIGAEQKRLPAFIIATVINIVLNYLLIPRCGAFGAAIASIISEVFVLAYQLTFIRKEVKITISKKSLRDAFICLVVLSAVSVGLLFVDIPIILRVVVIITSYVIIYAVLNIVLKNKITSEILAKFKKSS